MRTRPPVTTTIFAFGPFQLDPATRQLTRSGNPVRVGSRAFDMLVALVTHHGQVLSRRELMAAAWPGLVVDESNVRVQAGNLRHALGCGRQGVRYVASVSGRGYCFVAPVESRFEGSPSSPRNEPSMERGRIIARLPLFRGRYSLAEGLALLACDLLEVDGERREG